MNLIIDIGNTSVKYAFFESQKLIKFDQFLFSSERLNQIVSDHHGPVLISSVIDNEKLIHVNSNFLLKRDTKVPLKMKYETPETLGQDRLANAVAIHSLSSKKNALAIDCGTCLKFDVVIDGDYLGGSISPGLTMRFKSLHTFTGKLPLLKPQTFQTTVGKNTTESILSGCYRGMLAEINQTIDAYLQQFGPLEIYLTGGEHHFFADLIKNRIFADPFLTLKGLNEILLFQNK